MTCNPVTSLYLCEAALSITADMEAVWSPATSDMQDPPSGKAGPADGRDVFLCSLGAHAPDMPAAFGMALAAMRRLAGSL